MSTPTPIVVRGCGSCPLMERKAHQGWWNCRHPDAEHRTPTEPRSGRYHPAPDDCPLRSSPALVVLRPEGLKSPPLPEGEQQR